MHTMFIKLVRFKPQLIDTPEYEHTNIDTSEREHINIDNSEC
jgi:hypothetical protein